MYTRNIKQHVTANCTSYIPRNPEKYKGKMPIICRSSWEEAFCRWCDSNPSILMWASEEVIIKYVDPLQPMTAKGTPHFKHYHPDFVIVTENQETYLIEIKPSKETRPPLISKGKARNTMITEEKTWRINQAKWKAAQNWCANKGWTFKIITEKELFGK